MPGIAGIGTAVAIWLLAAGEAPRTHGVARQKVRTERTTSLDTPGVSLDLVEAPSPGWACPRLEEHLAKTQLRIWLAWEGIKAPREFPEYSAERQMLVWSEWQHPVTLRFTIRPPETRPPETEESSVASRFAMYVVEEDLDWLISSSAMDAVYTSRGRLVPEECGRNSFSVRVRFSPHELSTGDLIRRMVVALRDEDPDVRVLAATGLGVRGTGYEDLVVPALEPLLEDGDGYVCEAAAAALNNLGSR